RFRSILIPGSQIHGLRMIDKHPPPVGGNVVDIGCGLGDSTVELGRRVGPSGRAVGVDGAVRLLEVARTDARAAGAENVEFVVAAVEKGVPGGPYDTAFARFGTMFFSSPVIAMRNVRKSLRPLGTLCIVVWRKREANPCVHDAELVVRELLGDPPKRDQVT